MKSKTVFYLTSVGIKILGAVLAVAISILTIVFIYFRVPFYILLLPIIAIIILYFGCFLFFSNRIIIDTYKKLVIVHSLKRKKFNFEEIITVQVDTNLSLNIEKYCLIIIKLKNTKIIKLSG